MKSIRKALKLSQNKVAESVGVTQSYISLIEQGRINGLTVRRIKKLAKVLNITPVEMFELLLEIEKDTRY